MPGTSSSTEDGITEEDVRLFKSTLLARRFPGLKEMRDEEIRTLIAADRRANGRKEACGSRKTYPKSEFAPPPPKKELYPTPLVHPFSPVNPSMAKGMVMRPHSECFNCLGSDYNLNRTDYLEDKRADESKRLAPFKPNNPSQARDTIRLDTFLLHNVPGGDEKLRELSERRTLGRQYMEAYKQLYETRRGKTLIRGRSLIQQGEEDDEDVC